MSESTIEETARYGKPLFPIVGDSKLVRKGATVTVLTKDGKEKTKKIGRVLFTENGEVRPSRLAHPLRTHDVGACVPMGSLGPIRNSPRSISG